MERKSLFLALSFALFLSSRPVCAGAQARESSETLETLGSQIHTSLESLRLQSRALTEELERRSSEVEGLKTTLSDLSTSLTNTNRQLSDYETKLRDYELKLRWHRKAAAWALRLCLLFVLVRVVTLILRFKGIHLPEIINILA